MRDVSKGGGSPEERPYDVSRGQYRDASLSEYLYREVFVLER